MKLIRRDSYLKKLWRVKGTPQIKVITGIRRSGKSKLMQAFCEELQAGEARVNTIAIDFNSLEFESLTHYRELNRYIEARYQPGYDNCVFIDEVQMCEGFEKALNSLHASEKYDLYITGSNAFLMSSDLATLFTGRTLEIRVFPFSFREFLCYFELTDPEEGLVQYMQTGGMAGSYVLSDCEDRYRYLDEEVLNALVVRDIEAKRHIRNRALFRELLDYLLDNTSNITSIRKIANTVHSAKANVNAKTIGAYVAYLCEAFALMRVRRFDLRGRRYLASQDKYYLTDHAFRYARLGTRNLDEGHILENIVAIELLRLGFEVYVGTLYKKEIDFVALRRSTKVYIQVCDTIEEEETFKREVASLLSLHDAYPKFLLARTRKDAYSYEGIHIVDVSRWLANPETFLGE